MALLILVSALALAGIGGAVVTTMRDGYRRVPPCDPRTLER